MDAVRREVAIPVIAQAVMELFQSRGGGGDTWRAVALMRHGFGGHPFGQDARVARERATSRLEKL